MTIVPTWPESRFITLAGLRRHYVTLGDRGPAVVLLHGYGDSWRSFEPLLPALAAGHRIFAPDQRGHGLTAEAEIYAIADFADDAIAFLEDISEEPVHLVGHSLGSIVAQRVAQRRPELLRSLTLVGPAPTAAGNAALKAVRSRLEAFGDQIPDDFIETFQAGELDGLTRKRKLRIMAREARRLTPRTWRGALDGLLNEPEDPTLADIRLPALSIWGAGDRVFDRGSQVALVREIPHIETIHYAGVGHAPHWENPDRVATDIRSFIASAEAVATIHPWRARPTRRRAPKCSERLYSRRSSQTL